MRALFLAITLCLLPFSAAAAAENRTRCGEYSFNAPEGFELRYFEDRSPAFNKTLILNQLPDPRDFSQAMIYCLREKKTEYRNFILPEKERLHLQLAARRFVQMFVTATEDVLQEERWFKFSLLEERNANSREIRDRENFFVAIEADARDDDFHTLIFVCDFRKPEGFFNFEEYKSQVTDVGIQILDSIKKEL
jgi:hypothetical protein